MGNIRQVMFF